MSRTRKVEKRILPSGVITYRAPYVDSNNQRRSKNFPTRKEAQAFLLSESVPSLRRALTSQRRSRRRFRKRASSGSPAASVRDWKPDDCQYRTHVELHITPLHRRI